MFETLNRLPPDKLQQALERCCASSRWIEQMVVRRPFDDESDVEQIASEIWWSLDESDWREAFRAHPRIGDLDSLRKKFANTRDLAAGEQAAVRSADDAILDQLAQANADYETKFGYLFIVFATGKSADEMLAILRRRMQNPAEQEIRIAAEEQLKITQLRLRKLDA